MATFYGLFGWFANVCLVVNLVLMLGIMSLLQATLTLPGMAGILLTLGMAVDANILINERIREEQRLGRPPLSALEHGFTRAYNTIFDSNVAAFLAHVMLFVFGSGPVRGFAVTITVGIATSMFTAWMLTRLLVSRWYVVAAPAASAGLIRHVHPPCIPPGPRQHQHPVHAGPDHGPRGLRDAVNGFRGAVLPSRAQPGHRLLRRHRDGGAHAGPGRLRPDPRRAGSRAHPRAGGAAVRRPLRGADPPRRPAHRGRDAAGGHPGARGPGKGGAGGRRCCAPTRWAPRCRPNCSATACWRSASAW